MTEYQEYKRKDFASLQGKTISKIVIDNDGTIKFFDYNGELLFLTSYDCIFDSEGMGFDLSSFGG